LIIIYIGGVIMNSLSGLEVVEDRSRKRLKNHHRNIKLMQYQTERKKATNLYLSHEAHNKLCEDVGFKGAVLHGKYADMAEETNEELTDKFMAGILGWSERAVANNRRVLEKAFWFKKEMTKNVKGNLRSTYYLLDQKIISEFIDDIEYEFFEDFIKNRLNNKVKNL